MKPVAMNLAGLVESPAIGTTPYRIDVDGRPYVPVGDGGIVLGLTLGDPLAGIVGDHVAPGFSIGHPDPGARFALTAYGCVGNALVVRDGAAAGARGWVTGKRGEDGRLLGWLPPESLELLQPGDGISVRAFGQGAALGSESLPPEVAMLNLDPRLLPALGWEVDGSGVQVGARAAVASRLAGNGIGRPAQLWDVDLAFPAGDRVLAALRFGDVLAVEDLDVRHNMGFRRGWVTVGLVVHGDSPMPGHGPGLVPLLTGPRSLIRVLTDSTGHQGLTTAALAAESTSPVGGGSAAAWTTLRAG